MYRTDIGFFEPPDNELQARVFRILIANAAEPDYEESKVVGRLDLNQRPPGLEP